MHFFASCNTLGRLKVCIVLYCLILVDLYDYVIENVQKKLGI